MDIAENLNAHLKAVFTPFGTISFVENLILLPTLNFSFFNLSEICCTEFRVNQNLILVIFH